MSPQDVLVKRRMVGDFRRFLRMLLTWRQGLVSPFRMNHTKVRGGVVYKSRFSKEQIIDVLKESEGWRQGELCRSHGITPPC